MANTFKLKTKANVGITTQNVYVVPSATTTVVINTTAPTGSYALDVHGTINSNTDVQINGVSITTTASGDATALAIALG